MTRQAGELPYMAVDMAVTAHTFEHRSLIVLWKVIVLYIGDHLDGVRMYGDIIAVGPVFLILHLFSCVARLEFVCRT